MSPHTHQPWLVVGVFSHLSIALAFVAIAVVVAPRFRFFSGSHLGGLTARISIGLFLAFSALTHVELALQAIQHGVADPKDPQGVGAWFVAWHGIGLGVAEAAVAWAFLFLAIRSLSVNVINRALIAEAIDARIAEISREISERVKREAEQGR